MIKQQEFNSHNSLQNPIIDSEEDKDDLEAGQSKELEKKNKGTCWIF